MSVAAERKARTRRRILDAAGRLFRERGFDGTSVQDVMAAAGLTVGGFYAHFPSKEALYAEAFAHALDERSALYRDAAEWLSGREWLNRVVQVYLSRAHRDGVAEGCPLPTALEEFARGDPEGRERFERALMALVGTYERHLEGIDAMDPRDRALATVALSVGGIALARAVADPALSDRILKACRDFARRVVPPASDEPARPTHGDPAPDREEQVP